MSDEKNVIDPKDAHDHGYWGWVPDETPNDEYTVSGQPEVQTRPGQSANKIATADAPVAPAKPAKGATK